MLKTNYSGISPAVKTPIWVGGRIVGYIQDKCFRKRVKGSLHRLRTPKAWCISKEAFYAQILPHAERIIVEDVEAGVTYMCSTDEFARNCFEIQRGSFESQLAVTLEHWQVEDNGNRQLSLWGDEGNGQKS